MRIVSWNMGCGPRSRYRRTHKKAWQYLLDELRPDVALVQEALLSSDEYVASHGSLVWSVGRTRDSATAVLCAAA
jgi:hypothetical protein